MSPNELILELKFIDSAGHIGIFGKIGKHVQSERSLIFHSLEFGFEFDPSQLISAFMIH